MESSFCKDRTASVCCIPRLGASGRISDDDADYRRACRYHCARADDGSRGYPDLSMCIRSGRHGLHAIASREIKAGSVIVQCLPLAHSILVPPGAPWEDDEADGDRGDRRRRCARCFFQEGDVTSNSVVGRKKKFGRCSRCRVAHYCSRSCQAEDWTEQHKLECQYYAKRRKQLANSNQPYVSSPEEDAIPLLLRTFNSLKFLRDNPKVLMKDDDESGANEENENSQPRSIIVSCGPEHFSSLMVSPEWKTTAPTAPTGATLSNSPMGLAIDLMESHAVRGSSRDTENERGETRTEAACRIWGYESDGGRPATYEAIRRTLCAFQKNNFGIVNSLHSTIGEGVYPCAALLNHSCSPNCILRYRLGVPKNAEGERSHPPMLQIVACRDIASGEELCHSYVDMAMCTRERRTRLSDTHGFFCDCIRCKRGGCLLDLPCSTKCWTLWPLKHGFQCQSESSTDLADMRLVKVDIDHAMTSSHGLSESEQVRIVEKARVLQERAARFMLDGDAAGELSALEEAAELYGAGGERSFSPFHHRLYSLRCSYMSALLANGRVREAAEQCEHVVSFLVVAFSHVCNHPLLGLQLYTLGDLYSAAATTGNGGLRDEEKLALVEKSKLAHAWAREVMLVTHGENDPMVHALNDNLDKSDEKC